MAALLFAAPAAAVGQLTGQVRRDRRRQFWRRTAVAARVRGALRLFALYALTFAAVFLGLLTLACFEQGALRSTFNGKPAFDRVEAAMCGTNQWHIANLPVLGVIVLAALLCGAMVVREKLLLLMGTAVTATGAWLLMRPTNGCGAAGFPHIGATWDWYFDGQQGLALLVLTALLGISVSLAVAASKLADLWDLA